MAARLAVKGPLTPSSLRRRGGGGERSAAPGVGPARRPLGKWLKGSRVSEPAAPLKLMRGLSAYQSWWVWRASEAPVRSWKQERSGQHLLEWRSRSDCWLWPSLVQSSVSSLGRRSTKTWISSPADFTSWDGDGEIYNNNLFDREDKEEDDDEEDKQHEEDEENKSGEDDDKGRS